MQAAVFSSCLYFGPHFLFSLYHGILHSSLPCTLGKLTDHMKIVSRNVRGLGDVDKNAIVLKLLCDSGAQLICLQETKLQSIDMFKLREFLPHKYTSYVYQPADGTAGGTLIAWSEKSYEIVVKCQDRFSITVTVSSTSDNMMFMLTNVYAPCESRERGGFYDYIRVLKQEITIPWAITGDFNIYRYMHEKNNNNIAWTDMEEFDSWINELELIDIDICNSKYTWSNKRAQPTLIKLDRVLINVPWAQRFIHSQCKTIGRPTSDHKAIMLDTLAPSQATKIFRYEDYWLGCNDPIEVTKGILVCGTREMSAVTKLSYKLRAIRAATRAWKKHKRSITTIHSNVNHVIEWRPLSVSEFHFRALCHDKVKELCKAENQRWKRRAKIKWCQLGDENTTFYHTMATYRFRETKIKIFRLGNEDFFGEKDKLKIATDYFQEFFAERRPWTKNIDLQHIYEDQSSILLNLSAIFTWDEIKQAIMKAPPQQKPWARWLH
uniref:Uncharacterized protein n=1 Tax=Avena sativa TaxID=4498 RepID=A0ACD5ZEV6_AVESA